MLLSFFISAVFALGPVSLYTSLDDAISTAQNEDKKVLMIFSGSDWCRPCRKFKTNILENQSFREYVQQNLVLLSVDFPAKKKNKLSDEQYNRNKALADKYNKAGVFPHLVLMNEDKEIIKEIDYEGQSVSDFIKELN